MDALTPVEADPPEVGQHLAEVHQEARRHGAVDDAVIHDSNSGRISRGTNSCRSTPVWSARGDAEDRHLRALMMGVKPVPPMPPRLDTVKQPPDMSARPSFCRRAPSGQRTRLRGDLENALRSASDHRHPPARWGVGGEGEVEILLVDQVPAVDAGIELETS